MSMRRVAAERNLVNVHCGHPFESWSVIEKGSCPECKARITAKEIEWGWCVDCGAALRSDEKPIIALQTKDQLVRQVLNFLNRPKDAA
jgi:hypothetical protein